MIASYPRGTHVAFSTECVLSTGNSRRSLGQVKSHLEHMRTPIRGESAFFGLKVIPGIPACSSCFAAFTSYTIRQQYLVLHSSPIVSVCERGRVDSSQSRCA